jgi:hypothetical protein
MSALKQYLQGETDSSGRTPAQLGAKLDRERAGLIDTELKPLVEKFLLPFTM